MKTSKWLLGLAMICVALPAVVASVNVDFDKSADLSNYQTYVRQAVTSAPSSIVQRRIAAAIDRELEAKGWRSRACRADGSFDYQLLTRRSRHLTEILVRGW